MAGEGVLARARLHKGTATPPSIVPALPDAKARSKRCSWPRGADSTRYTSAPVSWPATDRPCTSRQSTSRHVASDPAIAYVGSNPMAAVAPLIAITES